MATTESVLPRQLQGLNIPPAAVIAAFLISSAVWIVNDQRAWSWDPAWYGDWTLRLWQARQSGLVAWASAMLHALGAQQPLMTWLGQFFVPLRRFTGEFESAILFVNLFTAAGTLTLIYCISRRLGADVLSSLIGVMVCGGSPLFIGLTHQYLVEMTQCFAAGSMMFAAWRVEKRSLARTLALVLGAVALSFSSKSSSVTFVLPMLAYIAVAFWVTRRNARPAFQNTDVPLLVIAVVIAGAAAGWYAINWQFMLQHFINATMSDTALNWGSPVNFSVKLNYWSERFLGSISPFPVVSACMAALIGLALAISIVRSLKWPPRKWVQVSVESGTFFALTLAGTIIATLCGFSLQINEDPRFLLPLMPATGILVGWSLSVIRNQTVELLLFIVLAANAAIAHAYAHGRDPFNITQVPYLLQVHRDVSDKVLLTETVHSTCRRETASRPNFIVVSYATLNVNTINFFSEKASY